MSCQTPWPKRFYRGKISRTAKHSKGGNYYGGGATQENKDLTQKANLLSFIVALSEAGLNKVPFYRRIFRPQSRTQGRG